MGRVHVAEIYSPERVVKAARASGMEVGLSMDLVTGWNFDKAEDRQLAEKYVREYKPLFLIGSPMCTMFSRLQELNKNRDAEKFEERLRKAEKHIQFVLNYTGSKCEGEGTSFMNIRREPHHGSSHA